jgi:hypothetical protein
MLFQDLYKRLYCTSCCIESSDRPGAQLHMSSSLTVCVAGGGFELFAQRQQHALAGHLPQRHGLHAHQHLVLGPGEQHGQQALPCGMPSAATAQAKAVGSRLRLPAAAPACRHRQCPFGHQLGQRVAHLDGLGAELALSREAMNFRSTR